MKFSLISSTKQHLDIDEVTWVTLPTPSGEIGVYPGHTALVWALQPGILKVETRSHVETFAIGGWVFETDGSWLSVLADMVASDQDMDTDSLLAKKEEAQRLMQEAQERWQIHAHEYIQAEKEYLKASALEQLSRYK